MAIIKLSESSINLIAAGEVVERPSSVVKELIENSIDSSAKNIDIYLEQAGKNLIIVSDDGCGMSKEDIPIAIERHTTSKLDESDILNIRSFGFRGEALSSIASVSKLAIVSKCANQDRAFKLTSVCGADIGITEVVHKQGTKVEVRDLFYCLPARLKFLKTDATELAQTIEVVKRLAMTRPDISFSLIHENKTLLKLAKTQNIYLRIKDILGENFINNAIEIDLATDYSRVFGFASLPTYHRASSDEQFTFINNRPIKDQLINGSIKAAYQDYIVSGRCASLVMFIEVPVRLVDVNVHPAKIQVRFQNSAKIRSNIVQAIKEKVAPSNKVSNMLTDKALDYFTAPLLDIKDDNIQQVSLYEQPNNYKNTQIFSSATIPIDPWQDLEIANHQPITQDLIWNNSTATLSQLESEKSRSTSNQYLGFACTQVHNNYIISQTSNAVIIVDQHAAHERIVYEELKLKLQNEPLKRQKLLIPIVIDITNTLKVAILAENKTTLQTLGLVIEKLADTKIVVLEVPVILSQKDITKLILDIADEIDIHEQEFTLSTLIESVMKTYACHHSVRSGQKLSLDQMNNLLRAIEQTPSSGQCCHGRPTYVTLAIGNIEKLFCRK